MSVETREQKTDRLLINIWHFTGHFSALSVSCHDARCNLSAQEIRAVEFLGRVGPVRMKPLADHLNLAASSTTTLEDNLEAKGEVKRERFMEDHRILGGRELSSI